ncbi:hypothetical protein ACQY1M_00075 [Neorhizobium sp. DAR64861/K0K2]|uniref:hypothetical protein n=1 Tax=Neorhizobium sp. DAR64861/K0K2 TaxID=3421956 RepID=UPI003D2CD87E
MIDAKAFGQELAGMVKAQLDPILKRISALEKRFDSLPMPKDGKDADSDQIVLKVTRKFESDLLPIREAMEEMKNDIPATIKALVDAAVSEIPAPVDLSTDLEALKAVVASIPAPQDGKGVTVEDVAPLIASEVEKRVSGLPVAKDGKDGVNGRDGVGLAGALIDRGGELVVTLTNGATKNLGPVVGKDGDPGKPGRDGFALEDFDASVMDDGRTVLLAFTGKNIDYSVELGFPVMLYRGVFTEGTYSKGDTVTWGGSLWYCDADKTDSKPGDGSKDWTLCAKKGRDGKDGVVKDAKPQQPVRVGVPAKGE